MKYCYLDESGTGTEPVIVIVGIVVDAYRMHITKKDWAELVEGLSRALGRDLPEIHARQVYSGRKAWNQVSPTNRDLVFDKTIDWLAERKHQVTFSAIDKAAFLAEKKSGCSICNVLENDWIASGFHVALTLQKAHKSFLKNKGHTLIIFDHKKEYQHKLSSLIFDPPPWSDAYYGRKKKLDRFHCIIDVPYFADSEHVYLLQVADLMAFILRRFSEIADFGDEERYSGESDKLSGWINKLKSSMMPASFRYPRKSRDQSAELFWKVAPNSLREL